MARAVGAALEVALFTRESDDLSALGEALRGADVVRVLVAPEGAETTTPEETTPASLVQRVRNGLALGDVPIAGGTDMYFCELNRTRPDAAAMDGVFWSQNAQVHAFDDISVLETTEAQGEQVRAAQAFAGGKPLFVGPVTLKRRYNVNATEAEEDDDPPDPRQTAQLGAAWMAASAKHLTEQGAAAVTYFETTGPRGVTAGGEAFPLHRVLGEVSSLCGGEVLACDTTGRSVRGARGAPRRRHHADRGEPHARREDGGGQRAARDDVARPRPVRGRADPREPRKGTHERQADRRRGRGRAARPAAADLPDRRRVQRPQKTMEQYTKLLGWGPWNVYRHEPPRLHDTEIRGEASSTRCSAPRPRR